MTSKIRLMLIRNGLVKPRNLTECRQAFPFPYDAKPNHVKWLGVARHVEPLHYVHKVK